MGCESVSRLRKTVHHERRRKLKVVLMTREWPPDVYGGAGVHVEYLARELRELLDLEVYCFGAPRDDARAFAPRDDVAAGEPVLQTMSVDLAMASAVTAADLVHSHTWYANFGGHVGKLLHGIPHVMTTHSLEPLRPWKAEQLGSGGYALSSFCERTAIEDADAVVAVSSAMRDDILEAYPSVDRERISVIHNGIDPELYRPDPGTDVLARYGIDRSRPYVLFVGRITRQKGLLHLLEAALEFDERAQVVLCAGAPDEPEHEREVVAAVERLRASRDGVLWIQQMLERPEVIQLSTHAAVFVVPSVYEPMGIVNLEAMACETAVVASRVGGIPEVVDDGVTGLLVPPGEPKPLAAAVNELLRDPGRAHAMGEAGRKRVLERFTWRAVAERTLELYQRLLEQA
jgi:starch synthase